MRTTQALSILILFLDLTLSSSSDCSEPCPALTTCISGECKCQDGYEQIISAETSASYCKASCQQPCMEYAACVAPNECECVPGYAFVTKVCDVCIGGCENGVCREPNDCLCGSNSERVCAPVSSISHMQITEATRYAEDGSSSSSSSNDGSISSDETLAVTSAEGMPSVVNEDEGKCPKGLIYYKGDCRPELEEKTDSCQSTTCFHNAKCNKHGKCECLPGYVLHGSDSNAHCMSEADMAAHGKHNITVVQEMPTKNAVERTTQDHITVIGLTVIVLAALVLLIACYSKFLE